VIALIFDTETTGVKEPRMVESAWGEIETLYPLSVQYAPAKRFNPGVRIECGAMATHHITDEDVAGCPPATEFRLPDSVEYLVGHHVDFDWQVAISCGEQPRCKRICTLALSRSLWPDADSHALAALVYHVSPETARILCPHAHGALADVELVAVLLRAITDRVKPETFESLWQASEKSRVPDRLTFGKYDYRKTGMLLKDVPRDYKSWLLRQPDVDPYLQQALRA
jgi:exodeoxyribonuclease X